MKNVLGRLFGTALLFALPALAQQVKPSPPAGTPTHALAEPNQSGTLGAEIVAPAQGVVEAAPKNDRIFWTLPNYLTVENAASVPPLTVGGKFTLTAKDSFDPVEIPFVGLVAGIGQAQNSEPSYGQGAKGYGKRYATALADNTVGNFMTEAVFSSALRQDPRYFQLGRGGFWRRTGYALSRLIITRGDSGRSEFNTSEIAGNAAAAGLSLLYHPPQDRNFSNTMSVWGTQIVWDGFSNELKEFWPDIRRWVLKKKNKGRSLD